MTDHHAPRMRIQDYHRYLDMAAAARTADTVARLRAELWQRWSDDARARDLSETLHVHQLSLPEAVEAIVGETSRAAALRRLPGSVGERSVAVFTHGSLLVQMYAPHGAGPQTPHSRDAIYVVARGSGTFCDGQSRRLVSNGDLLFAPAGGAQRFEACTDDFATWVIFCGREGGEATTRELGTASASVIPLRRRSAPVMQRRPAKRTADTPRVLAIREGRRK